MYIELNYNAKTTFQSFIFKLQLLHIFSNILYLIRAVFIILRKISTIVVCLCVVILNDVIRIRKASTRIII